MNRKDDKSHEFTSESWKKFQESYISDECHVIESNGFNIHTVVFINDEGVKIKAVHKETFEIKRGEKIPVYKIMEWVRGDDIKFIKEHWCSICQTEFTTGYDFMCHNTTGKCHPV